MITYANPRSLARLQSQTRNRATLPEKLFKYNDSGARKSRLLPSLTDNPTRNIGSVRPDRPVYYNRSVCQVGMYPVPGPSSPSLPHSTRKSTLIAPRVLLLLHHVCNCMFVGRDARHGHNQPDFCAAWAPEPASYASVSGRPVDLAYPAAGSPRSPHSGIFLALVQYSTVAKSFIL